MPAGANFAVAWSSIELTDAARRLPERPSTLTFIARSQRGGKGGSSSGMARSILALRRKVSVASGPGWVIASGRWQAARSDLRDFALLGS